jgi:lycopene beta-cyclase
VYVLPTSSTRALVEVTVFGAMPLTPAQLRSRLDAAIAGYVGKIPFTILRSEHGILPMGLNETPATGHPSWVKVGLMAGAARPSTGYAFQRIQCWAAECAHALLSGKYPVAHQSDPLPLRTMDRIFLEVLRVDPARAGALFFSLFSGTDPARIIRFLSGLGSVTDCLAVVAAMPVSPFVRAALALALRRGHINPVKSLG